MEVQLCKVANRREISDTMISVPYPFQESDAAQWIKKATLDLKSGCAFHFGIFERLDKGKLMGYVALRAIDTVHSTAELSFWISKDRWGRGFVTEACKSVLDFGFRSLGINRIYAFHMVRNPVSGRILAKLGFVQEGLLRECVRKWGVSEDVVLQAILKSDYLKI